MKLAGELFAAGEAGENLLTLTMLVIFMSFTSISQMHSLNLAMMYYEQLEVMPINMTCIMISWMVSGMFLLREGQYYSTTDLVWIFSSFAICCLGIKVLMSKIKQQRDILTYNL